MNRGKLIVLYGVNNLGKSTQAKKLVDFMNLSGKKTVYIKYPIYNLEPSGPMLNSYLRDKNPNNFSPREAQFLYILNRTQYQTTLDKILNDGANVVAEDYVGTGIAWGAAAGVPVDFLEKLNTHLIKEDIALLFTGQRFVNAIESNHLHEENNNLTNRVAEVLELLAKKNNWHTINANQTEDAVHRDIQNIIHTALAN